VWCHGWLCPERHRRKLAKAAVRLLLIRGSRDLEIPSGMLLEGGRPDQVGKRPRAVRVIESGSSSVEAAVDKVKFSGTATVDPN
jgi:hypothetical protein